MGRLVYSELLKTFLKKRTYLGFLIILIIVPLVEVVMKVEGGRYLSMTTRGLSMDFSILGNPFNGWFVAHSIMNSLWVQIPLLISFVAGDQLAGEATSGTYRLILIRPVSRTRVITAKYVVTVIYTVLFVLFLGGLSIGLALALLGGGDLFVIGRSIVVLASSDVAWRFCAAYLLASWGMISIAAIAFFFSSFVENAIGPIVATMGVQIVFLIISNIPSQFFDDVKPYLYTTYINVWQKCFMTLVPWDDVWKSVAALGAYSVGSFLLAWMIFVRKDILS